MKSNSEEAKMVKFNESDLAHFRRLAFITVALSTVTMLASVVVLPVAYQYIQRIQSTVVSDIEFCRVCYSLCFTFFL